MVESERVRPPTGMSLLMNSTIDTKRGAIDLSARIYDRFQTEHHDLFAQTWANLIERGEAKRLTQAQMRCVYECNPSGKSLVTVAEHDGTWAGVIAAIPTTLICRNGTRERAYQIGDFMVHPDWQGHGLGEALLLQLTEALDRLQAPVYTFPNTRSINIFLRKGYRELRSLRTTVFPLLPAAILNRSLFHRDGRGREISLGSACEIADDLVRAPRARGSIEKSGAYLRWRYGLIRDPQDFVFSLFGAAAGEPRALSVWSRFRYRCVPIQVLVDHVESPEGRIPIGPVAWQGMRRGAWIGACNLEDSEASSAPLLSVRMPTRFDPRPGRLLIRAEDGASAKLFSECRFATGDWMGF